MARARKTKKPLVASDFAGEGEPYTEVMVKISIRVLGSEITRSRLAVNVYPDPALEHMAKELLDGLKKDYGYNDEGAFVACLSENFNAWEDMNSDYPKFSENCGDAFREEDAKRMNAYIKESVEWAITLHQQGMEEAVRNAQRPGRGLIM